MLNRSRDTLYCGVREEVIKNAKPKLNNDVVEKLYEFLTDRYEIYKKKDVEFLPAPWTDNPIFLQVKFTNVRRETDRESKNLINNIASKTDFSLKDRFFNIMLMRFWNKYESYNLATGSQLLKFPLSDEDFKACINRVESHPNHTWWSNAYFTAPVRSWLEKVYHEGKYKSDELNYDPSPIYFAKVMFTDELWNQIESCANPEEVFKLLKSMPWLGGFIAYQFFVDFTYCPDYWFSENEYTVSGPGCTKGINLVFEDRDGMTHEECLFWLRDNQNEIFSKFGYNPQKLFDNLPEYDRYINVMSFENLHCELQKYMKCVALLKEGKKPRGKSGYNGSGVSKKVKVKTNKVDTANILDMLDGSSIVNI